MPFRTRKRFLVFEVPRASWYTASISHWSSSVRLHPSLCPQPWSILLFRESSEWLHESEERIESSGALRKWQFSLVFYLCFQFLDTWQRVIEVLWQNLYALVCCDSYGLVVALKTILSKDVVLAIAKILSAILLSFSSSLCWGLNLSTSCGTIFFSAGMIPVSCLSWNISPTWGTFSKSWL